MFREEAGFDLSKLTPQTGNVNGNNGKSNGNGKGKGNSNAGGNGNGYGKYDNPGQGNKYGIYKNNEIPLKVEDTRYQYLGQSTLMNKEYSDKGSPYAEYYMANNQVVSKKMFGLHGLVTPGREEALKTNGGLMYYQYDGKNSVTELTDRNGDEIEHYRYDAFGNIYTGITGRTIP